MVEAMGEPRRVPGARDLQRERWWGPLPKQLCADVVQRDSGGPWIATPSVWQMLRGAAALDGLYMHQFYYKSGVINL
jgi:hypothetical protein